MPAIESDKNWIDQMDSDEENEDSNERQVEINGTNKIITEHTVVDGEKVKLVRHYKIENRKVSKEAALRKTWAKFGASSRDPAGPNLATTMLTEEIKMEFLTNKDNEDNEQENDTNVVKSLGNQVVQCRNCGLNHWTLQCPYKNQLNAINKMNETLEPSKIDDKGRARPGFTSYKDGKRLDMGTRGKDENNTIRITNLPEETQDSDIRDLFKDFGRITRIFLAKDKATGNSKGFAFVSFEVRENAARAIKTVHGHGYNNLILSVEWARPSGNQ